jgi:hypothetical protein
MFITPAALTPAAAVSINLDVPSLVTRPAGQALWTTTYTARPLRPYGRVRRSVERAKTSGTEAAIRGSL